MTIEPLENVIYIEMEKATAGVLDTSSKEAAVEAAVVKAVGQKVEHIKPGDKVFVKAWAIDHVNYEGEWYRFVNLHTDGVLAIIHEKGA